MFDTDLDQEEQQVVEEYKRRNLCDLQDVFIELDEYSKLQLDYKLRPRYQR